MLQATYSLDVFPSGSEMSPFAPVRIAKIGDPGNIRNRYLAYLPLKMIALQIASAPPGFPHPELTPGIFTVIEFEPVGPAQTKLIASMVGFGQGEGYDQIYKHFEWGNDWTFEKLYKRFKDGPVDWAKELKK